MMEDRAMRATSSLAERHDTPVTGVAPRTLADDAVTEVLDVHEAVPNGLTTVDPEFRHEMIATAAYYIAEQRGFEPGHEVDDWYAAAAAVDATLARVPPPESGIRRDAI
jgi:hypothetical protein